MKTEDQKTEVGLQEENPRTEKNKTTAHNPKEQKRKVLSSEEIQKRKKILIYLLMSVLFIGFMYWIFAPSKVDKEKQQTEQGLNLDIPQPVDADLPGDKEEAYKFEMSAQQASERQSAMGALSDYFENGQYDNKNTGEWESTDEHPSGGGNRHPSANEINRSASAYGDIQQTLGNFYEDPSQIDLLQQQIDDLQAQLDERDNDKSVNDEMQQQLELMEKSYEMAAKYMPQGQNASGNPFEKAIERDMDEPLPSAHSKAERKEPTLVVLPDRKNVVSVLYQVVSDSVFIAEQTEERNRGFLSALQSDDDIPLKNTLKVSVHETVTIKDGETVRLRLLETARVANMLIPKNKLLTAQAKVQGNRLTLSVTSIEERERIIAVNLSAYDLDGQPGIFIPNSEEMNAVKEVVAGMGQSAGTSFTFSSSAGQQLAADAGKGIMQGASQYLNKKMREVKITLKSGHKLYLIPNK